MGKANLSASSSAVLVSELVSTFRSASLTYITFLSTGDGTWSSGSPAWRARQLKFSELTQ